MTRKHEDEPARKVAQTDKNTQHAGETTAAAPTTTTAQGAQDKLWKRAPLRLKADYKEVPGAGKNRVNTRGSDDGLWIDLGVQSLVPDLDESSSSAGVVAGTGAKLIDTFSAPMSSGASGSGTGKVSTHLHHAQKLQSILSIKVKLPGKATPARVQKEAIKFINKAAANLGDVDQLEARAEEHLASRGIPSAQVTIVRNTKATRDAGETAFHYRMRGPAQILLDIHAADAGQSEPTRYEATKTSGDSSETEGERHHDGSTDHTVVSDSKRASEQHGEHSEESSDVQYNKRVVETLVDIVADVDHLRKDFVEHVTKDLTTRNKFNEVKNIDKNWGERTTKSSGSKSTGHKESGDKDRRNIANGIQDITSTLKDVFSLPYLEDLKFVRRLQPWWLLIEGIDIVAGKFKASGKVHVEDSKEDANGHSTDDTHGHSHEQQTQRGDRTDTKKENNVTKRKVEEASQSLWTNFKRRVETTSKSYRSRSSKVSGGGSEKSEREDYDSSNRKESGGASERNKQQKQSGSTVTISASTITKFTKPVVTPTVVAGDCDVSTQPFGVAKNNNE